MRRLGMDERTPWENEPEYQAAKSGDQEATLNLVDWLLADEAVRQIKAVIGRRRGRQQQDSLDDGRSGNTRRRSAKAVRSLHG